MIILLFLNLIVGSTAFLLNYKILKLENFADSALSFFMLYFSQIVSTQLLLGVTGGLNIKNIISFNLLLFLGVWIISRGKKSVFDFSALKGSLSWPLESRTILLLICVVFGFGTAKIFVNLVNPPFGWDSLNYHFVFPVEWIKHANLNNPITIFDDPSPSYYPINGSLIFFWLMAPVKNVFFADLGQVPFFIIAFFAVFNIARKIGLDRKVSFYAASLFFITPNFFKQLSFAYVDVMVAALFLVCVNYLFLLNKRFSGANVLIYSLSLGLLLGTKTVAIPYSALLFIPFLYLLFKNCDKLYLSAIAIVVVAALGGFSYIRNFIETGNPLYPLQLDLFGKTFLKGVMDSGVYRAHFKPEDYSLLKLLFHEGLGLQTTIFILPAVFLALPASLIKVRKQLNFNLAYFLVLPLLIYFAYRYIIPLANTRYLYSLLGIGIVMGFYTAKIFSVPPSFLNASVIICALASLPELARRQELVASVIFTVLLFFLSPFLIKFAFSPKKPLIISVCLVMSVSVLYVLEKDYKINEYKRYIKMVKYSGFWPDAAKAWDWLNSNTQGNNIAYAGRPVPFPLYGENLKNNVYYVSVNKTDPAKLHYFPGSRYEWGYDFLSLHRNLEAKGNYRGESNYSVWLDNLLKHNTDFLFVYSLHQTKETKFPIEDEWAKLNPGRFAPVFTNETMHIYRVLR